MLPASRVHPAAHARRRPVTGLVDGRKVLALFDAGATVVLQGLHRYWPPLTELVRELELALGHPCQANAYLTPPGSQGFARAQRQPRRLRLPDPRPQAVGGARRTTRPREVLLEPGLSMYLPTGTPHSARSQQDRPRCTSPSASTRSPGGDVLQRGWPSSCSPTEVRRRAAGRLPRRPAPARRRAGRASSARWPTRWPASTPAEVADRRRDAVPHRPHPCAAGRLTDLVGLAELDDTTRASTAADAPCVLRHEDDRLARAARRPRAADAGAARPPPSSWSATAARSRRPTSSPARRRRAGSCVARRLVREGLLRIVG